MKFDLLIVDDEKIVRNSLRRLLQSDTCGIRTAATAAEALEQVRKSVPDLIVLDYKLPDLDGLSLLRKIRGEAPDVPVIMLTAHGNVSVAVQAMKLGADDFLEKGCEPDIVRHVVVKTLETARMRKELESLREEQWARHAVGKLVAESRSMRQLLTVAERYARSCTTLLLEGETGTGKSLLAEWIHYRSERHASPFIAINCGAIPKELIESELFGYEKGAFTGARASGKKGLIERANHGTLLLDEISELPLDLQAKLLQVLERGEFYRVGATEPTRVDVRFIAATNTNLDDLVAQKRFRLDLYYRINVARLHVPALRERRDDILPLAWHFIGQFNGSLRKQVREIDPEAQAFLLSYDWPGNVRELRNLIERAMILKTDSVIRREDLTIGGVNATVPQRNGMPIGAELLGTGLNVLQEVQKRAIVAALEKARYNKKRAAELLGIPRTTLHFYLKRFGIEEGEPSR